jgi:hypothetical protein
MAKPWSCGRLESLRSRGCLRRLVYVWRSTHITLHCLIRALLNSPPWSTFGAIRPAWTTGGPVTRAAGDRLRSSAFCSPQAEWPSANQRNIETMAHSHVRRRSFETEQKSVTALGVPALLRLVQRLRPNFGQQFVGSPSCGEGWTMITQSPLEMLACAARYMRHHLSRAWFSNTRAAEDARRLQRRRMAVTTNPQLRTTFEAISSSDR